VLLPEEDCQRTVFPLAKLEYFDITSSVNGDGMHTLAAVVKDTVVKCLQVTWHWGVHGCCVG
jgi:hypothetical protein